MSETEAHADKGVWREENQAKLQDVADAVGVSIATVSRVLNNKPGVGHRLRERIQQVAKEMNYSPPRASVRKSATDKADTVGIVFQDLTPGWLLTIFRGALLRFKESNFHVITALSAKPEDEYEVPLHLLTNQRVNGLLWLDPRVRQTTIDQINTVRKKRPVVLVQNYFDTPGIDSISIENTSGAFQAADHLLSLGYRRIMIITGGEHEITRQKLTGVKQAFGKHNVPLDNDYILNGHDNGWLAVQMLSAYLKGNPALPEAIFAFNDDMALAVLYFLKERGIRVPQDIAIVGFDGIPEADKAGLSTIETPMHDMGDLSAQLLIDRLSNPDNRKAQHMLLKGSLVVRKSCGKHLRAPDE